MGHADQDALLEPAVLALVAGNAHDDTPSWVATWLVLDGVLHRATEETLETKKLGLCYSVYFIVYNNGEGSMIPMRCVL